MKKILLSICSTLAIISMVFSLFLNTILGVFGLAATSVQSLQKLKASQEVVQRMTKRHETKKLKASKKIVKRAGKRIGAAAFAAATVGTVAVAAIVTGLEITDYCDEKEELQNDANILYGTDVEFNNRQCVAQAKDDSIAIYYELKSSSSTAVSTAFQKTSEYSAENWRCLVEASRESIDSTKEVTSSLVDRAKTWLSKKTRTTE